MNKTALITGITGMDASHLAEFLLEKEYSVFGTMRRSSTDNTWRINKILNKIEILNADITDSSSLNKVIKLVQPDEVYNLCAQSYVKASWDAPEFTFDVNAIGVIKLLEAVRLFGKKDTRIYQASSSEQFGKIQETPQTEYTKFYPRSVYGCSKVAAHYICVNYRESYNMFISCGISFNHESHRRGLEFVSRKISCGVAKIYLDLATHIELGNLESKRDFGYAPEYVEAFYKILQLPEPDDFVLATGETHSIEEFVKTAFEVIEIRNWKNYIKQDPKHLRPAEVDYLLGDSTKAKMKIGWDPKVKFDELVYIMVTSDIERLKRGDRFE